MSWIDDLPAEKADTLSEEVKASPTLAKYETLEDALKGHINAESRLGSRIRIPGEDAGETDRAEFLEKLINNAPGLMKKPDFANPEQSNEFYHTLGMPDEFSKYENPEGIKLDVDTEAELREILHAAKLTNKQYQEVFTKFASMSDQTVENNQTVKTHDMEELAGKWGVTLDARMAAAKKMNDEFYPGRDFDGLGSGELQALHNIHTSVTGKGAQAPMQPGTPAGMTPQEAEEQAAEIMRRIHDPKSDLNHSEKMDLQYKRIKMLETYVPEFANEAA
jgi:hypothetical protein